MPTDQILRNPKAYEGGNIKLITIYSRGHATVLEALSVRQSVSWSIGPSMLIESKSGEMSVLYTF